MITAESLLSQEKLRILGQFKQEDQLFVKWFLALTEIYHPTFHCEKILEAVSKWITDLGYTPDMETVKNIVVRVPGNSCAANAPIIALQAHLDMVLVGELDDQKIKVELESGKILKAPKSSLGADDGFGIATMLSILEKEKTFPHPPIELIFTTDEEVGFGGAKALKGRPYLKFQYLINMDSLKCDKVYIGAPGGRLIQENFHTSTTKLGKEGQSFLTIDLSGLHGGHSGMCIAMGYANAIKWGGRLLAGLVNRGIPFNIVSIEGGEKTNSIPNHFKATIAVPNERRDEAQDAVQHANTTMVMEYLRTDTSQFCTHFDDSSIENAVSAEDSVKIVDVLASIPDGPQKVSFPDSVETSVCLTLCKLDSDGFHCTVFPRSTSKGRLEGFVEAASSLTHLFGNESTVQILDSFEPWEPKIGSKFAKSVQKAIGAEIPIGILQVCVEPSILCKLGYDDSEMVAICPSVPMAHSVGEWIDVEEAMRILGVIRTVLEEYSAK